MSNVKFGSQESPLTKWGISVVLSAVLVIAGFFLRDSYASAQQRFKEHQDRLTALEMRVTAVEESRKAFHETLQRLETTDLRMEDKIDDIHKLMSEMKRRGM